MCKSVPQIPLAITWIIGWVLTKIVIRGVHHLTKQTETELDDQIVALVRGPLRKLVMLVGAYYALLVLPLDPVAWRIGTGVEYSFNEKITVGAAYQYMNGGDADIDVERGPLAGRLQGDYKSYDFHFVALNLIWRL